MIARRAAAAALVWAALAGAAAAQGLRPAAGAAAYLQTQGAARVVVGLARAGPAAARLASDPPRVIVDLPFDRWTQAPPPPPTGGLIAAARAGQGPDGRARLILDLAGPARLEEAALIRIGAGAAFRLLLRPGPAEAAAAPPPPPAPLALRPDPRDPPERPLLMIDPGHGGIDPGAVRGEVREKDLAFAFALALRDALRATGRWRVRLTRDEDVFVALDARVARAEAAGAAALVSLHANTVERGDAVGASVFTLSSYVGDAPGRAEAEALAAEENRAAVARAPAAPPGDPASRALTRIARAQALGDGRRLGDATAKALGVVTPMLRGRAHDRARFRVLTSSHTPSALIELGFMTNADDLARLRDPDWRARTAAALVAGLELWRHRAAGLSSAPIRR
ncbi:MAG: N-acetylmuramoyl-L-alanine amidase [Pseudomonadota bacterium]